MPSLGRIYKPDIRDHQHLMEDHLQGLAPAPITIHAQLWTPGPILDQGATPHCVGFGWRAHLNAAPNPEQSVGPDGNALYYAAKTIDGEPTAEDGSSVRSGAQVCINDKLVQATDSGATYLWAFAEWTVRKWILTQGPVVFGTNWTQDMFNPDAKHIVHPTGSVEGGHCYLCIGYDYFGFGKGTQQLYKFQNSWGTGWADGGFFYMSFQDVGKLLAEQGEACTVINV